MRISVYSIIIAVFTTSASVARDITIINFNVWHGMNRATFFNVEEKGIAMLEAAFDRTTPRRIDFILLSRHFSTKHIKSARVIFNEPKEGLLPSDHYGIEVVLDGIPE